MSRLNVCPNCYSSLHYSSGWDENICLECGWITGEEYIYKPEPISWTDWQIISPLLYKQYRMNKLKYEDLFHIFTFDISLDSIP